MVRDLGPLHTHKTHNHCAVIQIVFTFPFLIQGLQSKTYATKYKMQQINRTNTKQ